MPTASSRNPCRIRGGHRTIPPYHHTTWFCKVCARGPAVRNLSEPRTKGGLILVPRKCRLNWNEVVWWYGGMIFGKQREARHHDVIVANMAFTAFHSHSIHAPLLCCVLPGARHAKRAHPSARGFRGPRCPRASIKPFARAPVCSQTSRRASCAATDVSALGAAMSGGESLTATPTHSRAHAIPGVLQCASCRLQPPPSP